MTFQEIVPALNDGQLVSLLAQRTVRLIRNDGTHHTTAALDWKTIEQLLEGGAIPAKRIQITRDFVTIPTMFFLSGGKPRLERIVTVLAQGASMVLRRVDTFVPALIALTDHLQRVTRERVRAAAVVTVGRGGALALHYDVEDVVVLQVEGSKRWRVYGPPVRYPVRGMTSPKPSRDELVFDDELRAGDCLILPAGYWHECENGPARSLHVGVEFLALSAFDVMSQLAAAMADDEALRRPLTRRGDTVEAITTEVKATLIAKVGEKVGDLLLADVIARHVGNDRPDVDYGASR